MYSLHASEVFFNAITMEYYINYVRKLNEFMSILDSASHFISHDNFKHQIIAYLKTPHARYFFEKTCAPIKHQKSQYIDKTQPLKYTTLEALSKS